MKVLCLALVAGLCVWAPGLKRNLVIYRPKNEFDELEWSSGVITYP